MTEPKEDDLLKTFRKLPKEQQAKIWKILTLPYLSNSEKVALILDPEV